MAFFSSSLVVLFVCLAVCGTYADPPFEMFTEFGVPGVGFNRGPRGLPIWRFDNLQFLTQPPFNFPPFVLFAGFNTTGAFNAAVGEGGGNSDVISPATSPSALVATHFDQVGMGFLGVSPIDNQFLNLPLDDNLFRTDDFGTVREQIACATGTSDPSKDTRAAPCTEPITLQTWLEGAAVMTTRCFNDPALPIQAEMTIVYTGLLPNRLYSQWYVKGGAPPSVIRATASGGVPNFFVTDSQGYALVKRDWGFCPFRVPEALAFVTTLKSNGETYGAIPVPFLNQEVGSPEPFGGYAGLIPGTGIHVQLNFNVNGADLNLGAKRELLASSPNLKEAARRMKEVVPDWEY